MPTLTCDVGIYRTFDETGMPWVGSVRVPTASGGTGAQRRADSDAVPQHRAAGASEWVASAGCAGGSRARGRRRRPRVRRRCSTSRRRESARSESWTSTTSTSPISSGRSSTPAAIGEPKTESAARAIAASTRVAVVEHDDAHGERARTVCRVRHRHRRDRQLRDPLPRKRRRGPAAKPYVWGSVSRFDGQVTVFRETGRRPSLDYRDLHPVPPDPDDGAVFAEPGYSGLCGAIGTMMATEAIKLITGVGNRSSGDSRTGCAGRESTRFELNGRRLHGSRCRDARRLSGVLRCQPGADRRRTRNRGLSTAAGTAGGVREPYEHDAGH